MAGAEQSKTLTLILGKGKLPEFNGEEEEEEEREIEELGREVKEMAEKILESRRTIPDRLVEAFSSQLISQRPVLATHHFGSSSDPDARPGTSACPSSDMRENSELCEETDQGVLEKLKKIRAKTASNIAAVPLILKRMNDCIARINKIEQYNVNIHPVFKKKKK